MNRILTHPIFALFLTVLTIIFIISLQKTQRKSSQVAETADELKQQVDQLRIEVEQSENSLNPEALELEQEKMIRDELLQKKEDEIVFQLPPISPTNKEVETSLKEITSPISAWKKLIFE